MHACHSTWKKAVKPFARIALRGLVYGAAVAAGGAAVSALVVWLQR
ncbi:hypothetical protein [Kitasatospora sp. LaBMicrA B282]